MSQPGLEVITKSMEQLKTLFRQEMDQLQVRIENPASPQPAVTTATLSADLATFRNFVLGALQLLQDQLHVVSCEVDSLEMRSRRKVLLLHGVPEESNEETVDVIVKTVSEKLQLHNFDKTAISRCHRMGRSRTGVKPRPLLFKLVELGQRSKVWQAKTKLKNTGITMSEFLTKPRHNTFMAARQRFGVTKSWTQDGSVFVIGGDGARHRINCLQELEKVPAPSQDASAPRLVTAAAAGPAKAAKAASKVKRPVKKP